MKRSGVWYLTKKVTRHALTDSDNETYNPANVAFFGTLVVFLFLSGWTVIKSDNEFKAGEYGVGVGAIIAAFGMARKWEPNNDSNPDNRMDGSSKENTDK